MNFQTDDLSPWDKRPGVLHSLEEMTGRLVGVDFEVLVPQYSPQRNQIYALYGEELKAGTYALGGFLAWRRDHSTGGLSGVDFSAQLFSYRDFGGSMRAFVNRACAWETTLCFATMDQKSLDAITRRGYFKQTFLRWGIAIPEAYASQTVSTPPELLCATREQF